MTDLTIRSSRPAPILDHLRPSSVRGMLWSNRELIGQFTSREVLERHKGAYFGVAWNILNPLITLAIYTFVFGYIFQSRWSEAHALATVDGEAGASKAAAGLSFVLPFFLGHSLFHFFTECVNRAPTVITQRPNLVRKVMFPVEILPVVSVLSSAVYLLVSIPCLLGVQLIATHRLEPTALLLPLIVLPLVLMCMAASWVLAAVGVFVRDAKHVVLVLTHLFMFVSPVFYPVERIPESWRGVYMLNPLAIIIEDARSAVLWGKMPGWPKLTVLIVGSFIAAQVAYAIFMRARRGFGDVI